MAKLQEKKCIPCERGMMPLQGDSIKNYKKDLNKEWKVIDEHHLIRHFAFKDFKEALAFTNKVGSLAESEGHHPDIMLGWGKVTITLWTHSMNGLSENDFILAAKIDLLS